MLRLGQTAQCTRRFSPQDLDQYAQMSLADPQQHVPEPLIAALFSYLLGVELPGGGTNYLKQSLEFHQPAPLNAALTATVEITRLRRDKHLVDLATRCVTDQGALICGGRALVKAKDVPGAFFTED